MVLATRSFVLTHLSLVVLAACVMAFGPSVCGQSPQAATNIKLDLVETSEGWEITAGDQLFAGYVTQSGAKPIVYPIIGPGGQRMTRDYPMSDQTEGEKHDHIHHRSMWFTHGDVNGVDFWAEGKGSGQVVHRSGKAWVDPETGRVVIETENDWMDSQGKRHLSDTRRFVFSAETDRRMIDCEIQLKATEGDVNFGDTKEGSFGIRVAETMKVDAKLGGEITNAEGLHDAEAWAKKSNWVDYNGPVDGKTVGITVHYHPSSYASPCFWHVRTYGLFAANPFGVHHFIGGEPTDGTMIKSGESLPIRCRVVFYEGPFDSARADQDFAEYAKEIK